MHLTAWGINTYVTNRDGHKLCNSVIVDLLVLHAIRSLLLQGAYNCGTTEILYGLLLCAKFYAALVQRTFMQAVQLKNCFKRIFQRAEQQDIFCVITTTLFKVVCS